MIFERDVSGGRRDSGRPGLALVALSVVEQRLDAVRAVLAGATVVEVAAGVVAAERPHVCRKDRTP